MDFNFVKTFLKRILIVVAAKVKGKGLREILMETFDSTFSMGRNGDSDSLDYY